MLNKSQKEAVRELKSPLIVVAGPGTGKTTLISHKIQYLIEKKKINEDDILAITFTKKAAQEMSAKVETLTNKPFFAKTFHEFAMDIIEKYQKEIPDVDRNFKLIDEFEQLLFFLENLSDIDLSSIEIKNNSTLIAYELQSTISKLKDYGISLKDLEKLSPKDFNMKMDVFLSYSKYEIYKKKNNFVDFGDLLLYIKDLLENNAGVLSEVQKRYKYVLVDEFQDTNQLQLDIIKLIAKNNITIVGDQKQSIYGFRGANFSNLEQFKKHYSKFKQVYLDENYRCSKAVVENINKLIDSKEEKLKGNIDVKGSVNLVEATNENSQFNYITKRILKIKEGLVDVTSDDSDDIDSINSPLTLGILFRRKSELKEVAIKLKNLGIEFNSNETQNLFDFDIIKEILSLCEIIMNPREANNEIFKLLMDVGISNEVVKKISRQARLNEKSIYKVLKKEDFKDDIYKNDKDHLLKIIGKIDDVILLKNSKVSIYALIRNIIFKFNFYNYALISKTNETINIINNFLEFVQDYHSTHKNNSLERFLKVCKYSEKLGFISSEFKDSDALDENESGDNGNVGKNRLKIELLTLHSSKGKEFDFCIVPYLNERRFPTSFKRSKFDILEKDDKEKFLEEEKRLFFVGVSRTKSELDLISVKRYGNNKTDSKPSKFLGELKLKPVSYDKEYGEFNIGSGVEVGNGLENEIKAEVIEKIQKYILDNEYDKAKKEIDILKEIFGKKDLNFFIKNGAVGENNLQKQYYLDKLNGSMNSTKENVDFDESKMIYSVSQVKTYQSCPKKYLYSYIYKIPGVSRHYFDFGTSMHTVFEFLLIDIENTSLNPTVEEIEKLFSKGAAIMSREWISKGYDDANQEKEYFKKGIKAIREFINTQLSLQKANKNRRTVSNEKKFLIEIEGKRIIGFIDRVDKIGKDEYEIIDYKTSNSMETPAQLKKNLQLYVYAVALEKDATIAKLPKSVGLWYLIHDKIASVDVCDIDIAMLKKEMLDAINRIEKKDFIANPSFFNCKFCDYSDICENRN